MNVVPVIDLKAGRVVHARGGERQAYRPVRSLLADGSAPLTVVRGLLALHPFTELYVADLDAIEGQGGHDGGHDAVLEELRRDFPALGLWVDKGLAGEAACRDWLTRGLGDLVLGSESQGDAKLLGRLGDGPDAGRVILSLDFRGGRFLGPPALIDDARPWPSRVIAMSLARVGGGLGPDFERLRALRARAPGRRIFAAGGLRGVDDLARLGELGVSGVLAASALHDGRITGPQLQAL